MTETEKPKQYCRQVLAHLGCIHAVQPNLPRRPGLHRLFPDPSKPLPCGANEEAHASCKWGEK